MEAISIKLELSPLQFEELAALAQSQQHSVAEIAQVAISEWLDNQSRLNHARTLMRELGQGLDGGDVSRSVARDHDMHLYTRDLG